MPNVSIVIPAFNAGTTLNETLQSVAGQSWADWEAIIIDDGSTDDTLAIAEAWCRRDSRYKLISRPNKGLAASRNDGVAEASSPWLLFLDADDLIEPAFLETMLQAAEGRLGNAVVCCGWAVFLSDGRRSAPFVPPDRDIFDALCDQNVFQPNSLLVRREVFQPLGGFDTRLTACEDWDMWLRIARTGARFAHVDQCLALYRRHRGQMSGRAEALFREACRVIDVAHGPDPRVKEPWPAYGRGASPDRRASAILRAATWCAGAMIGGGLDPGSFLDGLKIEGEATIRSETAFYTLSGAVPHGAGLLYEDWPLLWERHWRQILQLVEVLAQFSGGAAFVEAYLSLVRSSYSGLPNWVDHSAEGMAPTAESPSPLTVFQSGNLRVTHDRRFSSDLVIVTFSHWSARPDLDAPGWQHELIGQLEIDAIHVVSVDNRWFLYPEMPEAMEVIASLCAQYREVVTWGASMGGYQAIKAAKQLRARRVIAMWPQYSIDPKKVPFDNRWSVEAGRIASFEDDVIKDSATTDYCVFFDPFDPLDAGHVAVLQSILHRIEAFHLRFGGHDVGYILGEVGFFSELSEATIRGNLDPVMFYRTLHRRRTRSPTYLLRLVQHRLLPERCREPLFSKALLVSRNSAIAYRRSAEARAALGQWREAAAAMLEACELAPHDAAVHHMAGYYLAMGGELEAAIRRETDAVRLKPDWFDPHQALAYYFNQLGDAASSIKAIDRALALRDDADLAELRSRLTARPDS